MERVRGLMILWGAGHPQKRYLLALTLTALTIGTAHGQKARALRPVGPPVSSAMIECAPPRRAGTPVQTVSFQDAPRKGSGAAGSTSSYTPPAQEPTGADTRPTRNPTSKTKAGSTAPAAASPAPTTPELTPVREADYYPLATVFAPDGIMLEAGGLAMMPDGRLAVATRRGEVWLIANPSGVMAQAPSAKRFAYGMHECLGLAYHNGALYTAQRGELTRLVDTDSDGEADLYQTVATLPISGNYHEYAYGPAFDAQGNAYINLNVGFANPKWWLGIAPVPYRGWCVRITPEGKLEPWAAGLRSPAGIMIDSKGHVLYAENQGDYVGSGWVTELNRGDFAGHPASLDWAEGSGTGLKARYVDVDSAANGQPMREVLDRVPGLKLPAVWFPHGVMGVSTCAMIELPRDSSFGPFGGQYLIGDQGQSKIMRMTLERVGGVLQGACYEFRRDFSSGVLRFALSPNGRLYVGQTARGWSSSGPRPWDVQRLRWTGQTPFELLEVQARPDGFELTFTDPVDSTTATDPASYTLSSFTYRYHLTYGSPVINKEPCRVLAARPSADGRSVRLIVEGLREGYIHEVKVGGVRRADRTLAPLHEAAYYTLNKRPEGSPLALTAEERMAHERRLTAARRQAEADKAAATAAAVPVKAKPTAAAISAAPQLPIHLTVQPKSWDKVDQTLTVVTRSGLRFEPAILECAAGARVRLQLANNDDMTHNWALVTPGAAIAVGEAAMKMGIDGARAQYIPPGDKRVLAHTVVLQPHAQQTIYFIAPKKPGVYPFVCSLPGHFYTMQGTLRVK